MQQETGEEGSVLGFKTDVDRRLAMTVHTASRIPCGSVARGTGRGGQSSVSEPGPNSKMDVVGAMTIIDCSSRGEREWGQRQVANATRQSDVEELRNVTFRKWTSGDGCEGGSSR